MPRHQHQATYPTELSVGRRSAVPLSHYSYNFLTTRFLPLLLASYRASSAFFSISSTSVVPWLFEVAAPFNDGEYLQEGEISRTEVTIRDSTCVTTFGPTWSAFRVVPGKRLDSDDGDFGAGHQAWEAV